jgi:hypothetical protein
MRKRGGGIIKFDEELLENAHKTNDVFAQSFIARFSLKSIAKHSKVCLQTPRNLINEKTNDDFPTDTYLISSNMAIFSLPPKNSAKLPTPTNYILSSNLKLF